jgi:OOP family OmpA-OmpF porin
LQIKNKSISQGAFMQFFKVTVILTAVFIGIAGCSSKPETKDFPKSANAKQEITNLNLAVENARGEDYDLLAPVSYSEARNSLSDARKMEKEDKNNDKVLKEVALGQAYLDRAKEISAKNRRKLQDVLIARKAAINANANTLIPKQFSKLDRKVKAETTKIENDKDDELKENRNDFITGYMALELAAIKKIHLGESKILIDQAITNGARDLTPKTLANTNEKYKETEEFITQNRYNTVEIQPRAAAVLAEARKLEATTASARGLSAATPEEIALRMQSEESRLTETENALAAEQGTNVALAASNTEMSKDQKLNAIYEEARTKFSPDEAEVYKQGKNLVIRLRSLEFPTAQAVIKGENFALLKKVDDVIESFDKSTVTVEGHTDSTGGKKINQKLSDERAEAVKKYLEANASDKVVEFDSKGFGYEKPLASNKTPEGRAQNRRVDVVIEPVQL